LHPIIIYGRLANYIFCLVRKEEEELMWGIISAFQKLVVLP
jgi:hypothetical protein